MLTLTFISIDEMQRFIRDFRSLNLSKDSSQAVGRSTLERMAHNLKDVSLELVMSQCSEEDDPPADIACLLDALNSEEVIPEQ